MQLFMPASGPSRALRSPWAPLLALSLVLARAPNAAAQDEQNPLDIDALEPGADDARGADGDSGESPGADADSDAAPAAAPASAPQDEARLLAWYGSLESDLGFARYDAEEDDKTDDTLKDHRCRFVVAPMLHL